ncbi:3-hydroxyacyl-CoA dehydrogenase NAD-binding domain-containing protein [Stappia sp.]|uniref:3-hydroxyacyl-CoA dehydrogenase NAD-binding domain-containing protein n=1 Tax=Stappia sp. TaxID=1870903 RepID=UPI003A99E92D
MTRVAVIGGGLIGAGWAAAFAGAGCQTLVVDPDPGASARVAATWEQARAVLARLGNLAEEAEPPAVVTTFPQGRVDLVQEALPENLDLKRRVLADVEQGSGPETVIASSSSSFTADAIAVGLKRPDRLLIGHPCNPPYLMPVVEIAGGSATSPDAMAMARAIYEAMGKTVLELKKPVAGHLVNRLQAALWREAVHLVATGAASLEDTERAVTEALAPRWCRLGPMSVFALAGAERGMAGFLEALGPQFQALFDDLGAPELDAETCRAIAEAYEAADLPSLARIAADRDATMPVLLDQVARMNRERDSTL